jgi:hypothetical protein
MSEARKVYNFEVIRKGSRVVLKCLICGSAIGGATLLHAEPEDSEAEAQLARLLSRHECFRWGAEQRFKWRDTK